ncbi:hypothetical protein [Thiothrix nivea]|uniref:Uncharacterized protein n=1 Tax=Thiothrix nivea (strain ATCC 35100 / DSM 5205 / JP2) TaxID=870187 RepID=A0A656HGY0_THINJ|nr:hypothetical protein [Thiothrix nivea]EIJ35284.1 hypothetical protein Thini_2747 [Thiothrix nivea DSM 5205]
MNLVIKHLKELFADRIKDDLRRYLALNENAICYLVLSDYVLHDANKANDVVTYTLIPCNEEELRFIKESIETHAKKDIKKSRSIKPEFIEILQRNSLFHISFLLGDVRLFKRSGMDSREQMLKSIQHSIDALSTSTRADEKEWVKILECFKNEIAKKSSNLRLIADISIVSLLTAYIMFLLAVEGNIREVAWLSDRDKMTEAYSQVAFSFCQMNYHGICVINNEPTRNLQRMYYYPTEKGIFYQELVRIPDYLAGTLADWNKSSPAQYAFQGLIPTAAKARTVRQLAPVS